MRSPPPPTPYICAIKLVPINSKVAKPPNTPPQSGSLLFPVLK